LSKKHYDDPHAKREAKKYDKPVPSREFILDYLESAGRPMYWRELCEALNIAEEEERSGIAFRLKAMVRDGQLMKDRRGRYCLLGKLTLIPGRVITHPDGFGFMVPDDGSDDIFISARQMRQVWHGDRVLVQVTGEDRRGRPEGVIMDVIERNTERVVGQFYCDSGVAYVAPDNKRMIHDVMIPSDKTMNAKPGQIVSVEIRTHPQMRAQPIGEVKEILGEHMAPGMEIEVALRSYDIPYEWPETLQEEVAMLPDSVTEEDCEGRKDLRDLAFVTIDGIDAQDFDDAVYCKPRSRGGWVLYVAIADVSHYVQPNTALDVEAKNRGNSVYFPGRVVPMLPEKLSNELCSLRPKVDRLSMVCEMSVGADGKLSRYRFYRAVIHSKARLTYHEVFEMLQGDKSTRERYDHLLKHIDELHALYQVLRASRKKRGAIDLDLVETRILFGDDKKIEKIVPLVRNDAHRLIEECMLLANVATARYLTSAKIPMLYRVHDKPGEEKITQVRDFLAECGLSLGGGKQPKPEMYARLLEAVKGRDDFNLIQTVILYSLQQAAYSPDNIGHFGLAYKAYAHFTSPIRRYPDLLIHRAILHTLGNGDPKQFHHDHDEMVELGEHCSSTERRADEATRDVVAWLKCEFMQEKVGEIYKGKISGITNFGIFVCLHDYYVEGLVHVTGLPSDYYKMDAGRHKLTGERSGRQFRLSDEVTVLVARVDLDERKIVFDWVDDDER